MFQVWQLGSSSPNFTLEGHEKGVNCIDYYSGGDKPYLISGADDRQVKIWDYQVRKLDDFVLFCNLLPSQKVQYTQDIFLLHSLYKNELK